MQVFVPQRDESKHFVSDSVPIVHLRHYLGIDTLKLFVKSCLGVAKGYLVWGIFSKEIPMCARFILKRSKSRKLKCAGKWAVLPNASVGLDDVTFDQRY